MSLLDLDWGDPYDWSWRQLLDAEERESEETAEVSLEEVEGL